MASPVRARATYTDIVQAPSHMLAEILDGELVLSPRPAKRQGRAASVLDRALGGFDDDGGGVGPGGWWILGEPEIHLGGEVLVPDLAGWRQERVPVLTPEGEDESFFALAPDWVCEVLSPSTARTDRVKKLPSYAREGVTHAWLVDPIAQTLEVFRLTGALWTLVAVLGGSTRVRAEPFEAAEIDLARMWRVARSPKAP